MSSLEPLAWIAVLSAFFALSIWIAVRAIRWAKRGSKQAALFGMGMDLVTPFPPPRAHEEKVENELRGKKSSDSSDPNP